MSDVKGIYRRFSAMYKGVYLKYITGAFQCHLQEGVRRVQEKNPGGIKGWLRVRKDCDKVLTRI